MKKVFIIILFAVSTSCIQHMNSYHRTWIVTERSDSITKAVTLDKTLEIKFVKGLDVQKNDTVDIIDDNGSICIYKHISVCKCEEISILKLKIK